MEDKEMLEQTNETENVETQTTEQIEDEGIELTDTSEEVEQPKLPSEKKEVEFTPEQQEKLDEILKRRLGAVDRKYERELSKRDNLIEKLKVGMGKESIEDLDAEVTDFYSRQGVELPKPKINERDEIILAKADAEEIIELGIEEMERIANDIAKKPIENRTVREKTIYNDVVTRLTFEKAKDELSKQGADVKILDNEDFKKFSTKFSAATPVTEVYELYNQLKTTKKETPKPIGSVKSDVVNNEIKEYYTPEEMKKFTIKDYLENPKLMEAVENSLAKK